MFAGPLPPCISAAQSANGHILVTDTLSFDDPDETHPRKVIGSVYQVYRRSTERNDYLRLNGPGSYWADPFWKVETHAGQGSPATACSYVLVPNDGEFLVFVGQTPGLVALTIYHHRSHDPALGPLVSQQGELVREIKQADLWPCDSTDLVYTDHTPMWFADGHFTFSPDQQKVMFQDKRGRSVEIDLTRGDIKHQK